MRTLFNTFFALFVFSICACGPNYIYNEQVSISDAGWTYADTLDFSVDIQDTTSLFNLCLDVQHSQEFASQNMYLRIFTKFPDGKRLTKTLSIDLMDNTGKWYGKCSSSNCKLLVYMQQQAFFNQLGEHTFTVEQFMRTDSLQAINKIGFKIEDSGEDRVL